MKFLDKKLTGPGLEISFDLGVTLFFSLFFFVTFFLTENREAALLTSFLRRYQLETCRWGHKCAHITYPGYTFSCAVIYLKYQPSRKLYSLRLDAINLT